MQSLNKAVDKQLAGATDFMFHKMEPQQQKTSRFGNCNHTSFSKVVPWKWFTSKPGLSLRDLTIFYLSFLSALQFPSFTLVVNS